MNWKEVPHLFANGKFKAIDKEKSEEACLITGTAKLSSGIKMFLTHERFLVVEESILIARRIEDMTDEEEKKFYSHDESSWRGSAEQFLYLLSIGVYPGPQIHFGESVIDIKEVS